MVKIQLNCPLCNESDINFITNSLRRGNGEVYKCFDCEHEFLVKETHRKDRDYYKEEYWKKAGPSLVEKVDYQDIFDSYVNFQSNRLKLISPYLSKEKSLIEIGCSAGHFLYNVKDLVKKVVGVDFDEGALQFCAEKNSCQIVKEGIDGITDLAERFDIICCFQVLEHIDSPSIFLEKLRSIAKKGAIVYLEVPNIRDPLLSLYDIPSYLDFYYHEDHLHYFSKKSLKILLDKVGLKGELFCYQDYNLFNHMNWLLTGNPQKSCLEGLGTPNIAIKDALVRKKFSSFFNQMNENYKEFLAKEGVTDNLAFIGKFS